MGALILISILIGLIQWTFVIIGLLVADPDTFKEVFPTKLSILVGLIPIIGGLGMIGGFAGWKNIKTILKSYN